MNNIQYCILGRDGGVIPVSATEKGAKNYATRNGYTEVYALHNVSWAVWKVATKTGSRWSNEA
jgi:hypothetical protein